MKKICIGLLFFLSTFFILHSQEDVAIKSSEPKDTNLEAFRVPDEEDPVEYGKKLLNTLAPENTQLTREHLDAVDDDAKQIYPIAPHDTAIFGYSSDFENEPVLEKIRDQGDLILREVREYGVTKIMVSRFKKMLDEINHFVRFHKFDDLIKRFSDGGFGLRQIITNLNKPRPKELFMVRELRSVIAQEAANPDTDIQKERRWAVERYLKLTEYLEKTLDESTKKAAPRNLGG